MSYEEAVAWLRGERSMTNYFFEYATEPRAEEMVRTARADAALTEQAYWIVRAHKEGLVSDV